MKRLFLVTKEARDDLRDILLDIAEDSPDAAQRLQHQARLVAYQDKRQQETLSPRPGADIRGGPDPQLTGL